MIRKLVLVTAGLVLFVAAPAAAGGWAVSTLDQPPSSLVAGQDTQVGFMIRQHGKTPVNPDSGTIGIRLIEQGTGRVYEFPATQTGPTGHFVATVRPPTAGPGRGRCSRAGSHRRSWGRSPSSGSGGAVGAPAAPAAASAAAAPASGTDVVADRRRSRSPVGSASCSWPISCSGAGRPAGATTSLPACAPRDRPSRPARRAPASWPPVSRSSLLCGPHAHPAAPRRAWDRPRRRPARRRPTGAPRCSWPRVAPPATTGPSSTAAVSVGPDLGELPNVAASRVRGLDAAAYVRQSIRTPQAFVVAGYTEVLMPTLPVDDQELDALVRYLLG